MPDVTMPPPVLVESDADLKALAQSLARRSRVAFDTESNSLYAYQERVCLIQCSTEDTDYIIDTLAIADLSPLAPILADAAIEKVLHGAEYDVIVLKRDFGFQVNNLFDTRVAARTLGMERTGLGNLLQEAFGARLDKRLQRANWGRRPLPTDLLDYARLDTRYLLPLRDRLAQALRDEGRWQEALELCEYLTRLEPTENHFDPKGFWRIAGAHRLSPRQRAILKELYLFREQAASRMDRPPFKVMNDGTLLAIAQTEPQDLAALRDLPGMTAGQVRRYGQRVLAAVARGRSAHPPKRPARAARDEVVQDRYERLRQWRKKKARQHGVESDLILPRELLISLARRPPRDMDSLRQHMAPLEWRFQTYGAELLNLLRT